MKNFEASYDFFYISLMSTMMDHCQEIKIDFSIVLCIYFDYNNALNFFKNCL